MKKLLAVVAIAMLGAASSAQAQETGLSISGRVGYAFPMGEVGGDPVLGTVNLDDIVDGNIPVGLEIGYRFARALEIGGYLEYGWGREADGVAEGVDVTTLRIGAQLNYLLAPEADLQPFVGVGAGWTRLKLELGGFGDDSVSGYDFTAQGGLQWRVAPNFAVGPFAAFTVGQFTDSDIDDKGWHEWIQVGLRGTFSL